MLATNLDFHQTAVTSSTLKGVVFPDDNVCSTLPWTSLSDRLSHMSLMPHDVGGSGDCFFKAVSYQLCGTAHLHFEHSDVWNSSFK